jgi:hypothetical protein
MIQTLTLIDLLFGEPNAGAGKNFFMETAPEGHAGELLEKLRQPGHFRTPVRRQARAD